MGVVFPLGWGRRSVGLGDAAVVGPVLGPLTLVNFKEWGCLWGSVGELATGRGYFASVGGSWVLGPSARCLGAAGLSPWPHGAGLYLPIHTVRYLNGETL